MCGVLSQAECGFQFTSKMEGMFTDLANSKNTLNLYRKVGSCLLFELYFHIHVIDAVGVSTGGW